MEMELDPDEVFRDDEDDPEAEAFRVVFHSLLGTFDAYQCDTQTLRFPNLARTG